VIAAHPTEANGIPIFAKRKVFIESELSLPFYKIYYSEITRRTYVFFKFYYNTSLVEVRNIALSNGVDYIIIDRVLFTPEYIKRQNFYFEPFNNSIKTIIQTSLNSGFALANPPQRSIIWDDNRFVVAKVSLLTS